MISTALLLCVCVCVHVLCPHSKVRVVLRVQRGRCFVPASLPPGCIPSSPVDEHRLFDLHIRDVQTQGSRETQLGGTDRVRPLEAELGSMHLLPEGSMDFHMLPHHPSLSSCCKRDLLLRAAESRSSTDSAVPGLQIPPVLFPRCWQTSPREERSSAKPEMTCWGRVGSFHSCIMCWDLYKRGFFAGWPEPWRGMFAVCGSQTTAGTPLGSGRARASATEHFEVRLDLCVESQHRALGHSWDVAQASEQ